MRIIAEPLGELAESESIMKAVQVEQMEVGLVVQVVVALEFVLLFMERLNTAIPSFIKIEKT